MSPRKDWKQLSTQYLFESRWFNVRQDRVRLPTGTEIPYTLIEHSGYAIVVPLLDDGRVLLENVYRYSIRGPSLECPAGGLDGDAPEVGARRELREETGYVAKAIHSLGSFYGSIGISNERFHVFLATGVHFEGEPVLEETEQIELVFMDFEEAHEWALTGRVDDGPSSLSLLLAGRALRALKAGGAS